MAHVRISPIYAGRATAYTVSAIKTIKCRRQIQHLNDVKAVNTVQVLKLKRTLVYSLARRNW